MSQHNHAASGRDPALHMRVVIGWEPTEIPALRRQMRELVARAGFDDRANDLTLAVAELIANAQEHGEPPIEVEAWADGRLVIEVRDSGGGLDHETVFKTHPPSPYNHRGRGLWIVRQLMDVVVIRSDREGTTVRVELSPEPHLGA